MGGKSNKQVVRSSPVRSTGDNPTRPCNAFEEEIKHLQYIIGSTGGQPPKDVFNQDLASGKELATKARDSALIRALKMYLWSTRSIESRLNSTTIVNSTPWTPKTPRLSRKLTRSRITSQLSSETSLVSERMNRIQADGSVGTNGAVSTTASSPAPVIPFPGNLELHARKTGPSVVDPLRRTKPFDIMERVNRVIHDTGDSMISHRKVPAVRLLPSGDVILRTNGLKDMEQLTRAAGWCQSFGDRAQLKRQSWRVVIKGINYPTELDGLSARLQAAENAGQFISPTKITYSG